METEINWEKAVQTEILKRDNRAAHFLEHIFGVTEYLITDASSLRDFQDSEDIQVIRQQVFKTYEYPIQKHHLSMPLWELLDELERYFVKARSHQNAPATETSQRELAIEYFFDQVLGVGNICITDTYALGDFVNFDDPISTEIVDEQTYRVYGTRLTREHYEMPFWKLLDELEENCLGSELEE
jgi:hypothetical protein